MRIERRRGMPLLALLAVLVLALFAGACGDDDDDEGGTAATRAAASAPVRASGPRKRKLPVVRLPRRPAEGRAPGEDGRHHQRLGRHRVR